MTRRREIRHEFVEFVPATLAEGVLYVSLEYGTASHLCCCGCGNKVVTPLSPTDWRMIYDGETVSLDPSMGTGTLIANLTTGSFVERSGGLPSGHETGSRKAEIGTPRPKNPTSRPSRKVKITIRPLLAKACGSGSSTGGTEVVGARPRISTNDSGLPP